ncbi:MAG: protein tyrosine phosphatase [Candidatus Solibacter sp.]|nr:protein tyrosine phosphatase [Candidatus Solibacter sp.]
MMPALRKRVLFVCIGNACRSQMAEAFARSYGDDVLIAASAGVAPAVKLAPDTIHAMEEKNIDIRDHFPKGLRHLGRAEFDIVVNMSGMFLPETLGARIVDWEVADPVSMEYSEHCEIRDDIEQRVMKLVLELRRTPRTQFRGQGSGRLDP